jgi:hypothetical protein
MEGCQAFDGVVEIVAGDDIVSIEHRSGFVTTQGHRHLFGHPGPNQVSDTCPAEVVWDLPGEAGLLAGCAPGRSSTSVS